MRLIDYRTSSEGLGGTEWRYFKDCWLRIKFMGYKTWLEGPEGDSEAPGLDYLTDFREDATWRGVHGYISFGFVGGASDIYITPGITGGTNPVWAEEHAMWLPQQYINWKENYFEPQPHANERKTACHYPNAVRIWLRDDVRAFVHFNVDITSSFSGGLEVRDPATGVKKYDSFDSTNLVPPI